MENKEILELLEMIHSLSSENQSLKEEILEKKKILEELLELTCFRSC